MKRFILTLALLLCLVGLGSGTAEAQQTAIVFENYDLDSTTEIFCDTGATLPRNMNQCTTGSAAEDGWIIVDQEDFKGVAIHIDVMALNAGTIDVQIYGRARSGATAIPLLVVPIDYSAAETQYVVVPEALHEIRIGLVINGTDDADAADEDISIYYIAARRLR